MTVLSTSKKAPTVGSGGGARAASSSGTVAPGASAAPVGRAVDVARAEASPVTRATPGACDEGGISSSAAGMRPLYPRPAEPRGPSENRPPLEHEFQDDTGDEEARRGVDDDPHPAAPEAAASRRRPGSVPGVSLMSASLQRSRQQRGGRTASRRTAPEHRRYAASLPEGALGCGSSGARMRRSRPRLDRWPG